MEKPTKDLWVIAPKKCIIIFCSLFLLLQLLILEVLNKNYCRPTTIIEHSLDVRIKESSDVSIKESSDVRIKQSSDVRIKQSSKDRINIGILVVVDRPETDKDFKTARDSLTCYAKLHKYTLQIVYTSKDKALSKICPHKEIMFKRHCFAANLLQKYDWMLFLDGDIGVINPSHRIEEYIDESVNLIFYDRFFDWEVATGSYLAKNSQYSIDFLNKWANFEYRLPNSYHGLDNGVIHAVLMEELAPKATNERNLCERLLNNSKDFDGLFAFEACTRLVLGANRHWAGKIKITPKGVGWVRDGWITKTKFCSSDFMFHGWKKKKLGGEWVMPFKKPADLARCSNGFASWTPKSKFKISDSEIKAMLKKKYVEVEKKFLMALSDLSHEVV